MNSVSSANPLTRYPYSPITRGVSQAVLRGDQQQPSASVIATTPVPETTLHQTIDRDRDADNDGTGFSATA